MMRIKIADQIQPPIIIRLFPDVVPNTVNNFLYFVDADPGYAGTAFHRIIPQFMIQGGDIEHKNGMGGYSVYGGRFADENFKLRHDQPGRLSMANAGPDTNGSQFFITTVPTPHLDGKHVVFGQVVKGMETVYRMEQNGTEDGTPRQPVTLVGIKKIHPKN